GKTRPYTHGCIYFQGLLTRAAILCVLPSSINIDRQSQPEESKGIASQHVARPVRAKVNARDSDQSNHRAANGEQSGAKRRRAHQRVDEVEKKTEKGHIRCDVARGKASADWILIDLDQIRRWARPTDDGFDRVDHERTRSRAYRQASRFDLEPES